MKAQASVNGITFVPVPEFSDVEAAFGADEKAFFNRRDLPKVPRKYEDMANSLFYSGGKVPEFINGVDRKKASKAIRAWLCSYAPAHESKAATVGYALWAWIEGVEPAEAQP